MAACAIVLGWVGINFRHDLRIMPLLVTTALAVALFTLIRAHRIDGADALILAPDEIKLASEMETALANGEFFLVFQPQIDLGTSEFNGVEALIRWRKPDGRTVNPDEFIRVAELSELIVPMGALVLRKACREAAAWHDPPLKDIKISVNVSALQLTAEDFAETVIRALAESGLAPERLVIELTESALVGRGDSNIELLNRLRSIGVRVAIDDFGTGYSCLAYLRDLPNDYLKIDRSFVKDVPGNERAESVARAIVGIGRTLGFRIIAEGIETWEQADFLKGIWCEEGQGYLFGRPMNSDQLSDWASNWPQSASRMVSESGCGREADV